MEDFNNWSKIAEAFDTAQSQVVRKTAFDWQANAQAQIRTNGQIDTGHMVNSGYVVTSEENTYKGSGQDLPPVERPSSNKEAFLAFAAFYAWWQNYGTHLLPARPFLEPSWAQTQPGFDEALRRIDEKLKEISH
jgi:hypothetical protein